MLQLAWRCELATCTCKHGTGAHVARMPGLPHASKELIDRDAGDLCPLTSGCVILTQLGTGQAQEEQCHAVGGRVKEASTSEPH